MILLFLKLELFRGTEPLKKTGDVEISNRFFSTTSLRDVATAVLETDTSIFVGSETEDTIEILPVSVTADALIRLGTSIIFTI